MEKMFTEQERTLGRGHELPDAILRNVIDIHEELHLVEEFDHQSHADKVKTEYETVCVNNCIIKHLD
jgi:hypothetical protein